MILTLASSDATEAGTPDDLAVHIADGLAHDEQVVSGAATRGGGLRREQRDDVRRLAVGLGEVLHLPVGRAVDGDHRTVDLDRLERQLAGGRSGHKPRRRQLCHLTERGRPAAAEADDAGDGASLVLREEDKAVRGGVDDGHF